MDERLENERRHGQRLRKIWSGTFWYWETPAGRLRWQRRLRMLTAHISKGMRVLEVGAGVGYFTEHIVKTGAQVCAIDISPDLLEVAKERITADNVEFKVDNAYDMQCADQVFDSVVGSSVLHHLDVEKALAEFYRVLKPGGSVYFTEPNMVNPQVFLERHTEFFGKLIEKSPDETAFVRWPLKKDFERFGFQNIEIVPFDFLHPLTPSALIPFVDRLGRGVEHIPFLKEIAGSLYIKAFRP